MNKASLAYVKKVLGDQRAKKKFGQNFIKDENILNEKINEIEALDITDSINKQVAVTYDDARESEGLYYISFPEYYCLKNDEIEVHYSIIFMYYPASQELVMSGSCFNDENTQYLFVYEA